MDYRIATVLEQMIYDLLREQKKTNELLEKIMVNVQEPQVEVAPKRTRKHL